MNKRIREARDAGFTLIELLVIVLVIGVLSGIVVLAVSNSTADAKKKACLSNGSALLTALDVYKNSPAGGNGSYPTANGTPAITVNSKSFTPYTPANLSVLVPNYIKTLPTDTETAATAYIYSDSTTVQTLVKATGTACDGTILGG